MSTLPFVFAWHSYESELEYFPQLKSSFIGTEVILSLTERVTSLLIDSGPISKGFLSLPTILSNEESATKLVERAWIVQECVVVQERVSCRGGKRGQRQGYSTMPIVPSLCFTSSFTQELKLWASRVKKVEPSLRPMLPIEPSYTYPSLTLKSYLAYLSTSSLCLWLL